MEQWNFYLSGILYGICERTKDCVCHRPLDVHTGLFKEWEELTEDETWYLELGKWMSAISFLSCLTTRRE